MVATNRPKRKRTHSIITQPHEVKPIPRGIDPNMPNPASNPDAKHHISLHLYLKHRLQTPLHTPQPPSPLLQLIALPSILSPLPRLVRTLHRVILPPCQRSQVSF